MPKPLSPAEYEDRCVMEDAALEAGRSFFLWPPEALSHAPFNVFPGYDGAGHGTADGEDGDGFSGSSGYGVGTSLGNVRGDGRGAGDSSLRTDFFKVPEYGEVLEVG